MQGVNASVGVAAAKGKSVTAPWLALSLLFAVYLFNSIDRYIVSVIAQPIKEELHLADWELGLMTGFAFSMLYVLVGFPMAKLADRKNRVNILSICLVIWSGMTALCGLSANFIQLCLFRMGVGIGEAGCLPASHSLISDYFSSKKRAKALAIFGLGLPLGGLVGMIVGGAAMDQWGWRATFFIVGIPGILVALVVRLLLKEPLRGRFDVDQKVEETRPQRRWQRDVAKGLWRSPVARNVILGVVLTSFFGSATSIFLGPYLIRRFDLSYTEVGLVISISFMLGSAISTLLGGLLADWAGRRDMRWNMWIPAIGIAASGPLYIAAYMQSSWIGLGLFLFLASVVGTTHLALSYAVLHNASPANTRASVTVIVQFCVTLIGQSIGPLVAGLAIDMYASRLFEFPGQFSFLGACPGGRGLPGGSPELDQTCRSVLVDATQFVMIAFVVFKVWPAFHFFQAARHFGKAGRTTMGA